MLDAKAIVESIPWIIPVVEKMESRRRVVVVDSYIMPMIWDWSIMYWVVVLSPLSIVADDTIERVRCERLARRCGVRRRSSERRIIHVSSVIVKLWILHGKA